MSKTASACKPVAAGGVGESGATALLTHTVGGPTPKMVVLRTTTTSLCANTGAVAVLTVNGLPVASGDMTAAGSLIQHEAAPGSCVAAAVHTIPLFNNILCARLGELELRLDECDLVTAGPADRTPGAGCLAPLATRDWYAWTNRMPPPPDEFHVVGEVQVPNPGVAVLLTPRTPQGINPKIILLDLVLVQKPGLWIQIPVWKPARYDKARASYTCVEVFSCGDPLVSFPADDVQ